MDLEILLVELDRLNRRQRTSVGSASPMIMFKMEM